MSSNAQKSANYKQRSCSYDSESSAKRSKGEEPQLLLSDQQIAIVIPIMASRLQHMVTTYCRWRRNGFIIVFAFKEVEEEAIINILQQHAPDMLNSFKLHPYVSNPSNAGIAKGAAYDFIKQNYLNDPIVQFAVLLDDTVDDIINTHREESIVTNPTEFYDTVERYAKESPVFGGTVAYERHQDKCQQLQDETARVKRGFLHQALVFSCRGIPTLTKHFRSVDDDYITKMRGLAYRRVPFGEDVSFQIALYELEVLHKRKSAQFWGIGVSRIKHKSATKRSFDQLDIKAKKALKAMMIYLREQHVLCINPRTKQLGGVKIIPGRHGCIRIKGKEGERPWREAYEYAFSGMQ